MARKKGGKVLRKISKTFVLKVETENTAFEDAGEGVELARILRKAADRVETGAISGPLMDINGNRVGEYSGGR